MKNNRNRLFEVMQRVDKTFKPKLNESREHLLDYFKTMWSKSENVKNLIQTSNHMIKKYGKYLDPRFDWDALNDNELREIWDSWSVDEHMLTNR